MQRTKYTTRSHSGIRKLPFRIIILSLCVLSAVALTGCTLSHDRGSAAQSDDTRLPDTDDTAADATDKPDTADPVTANHAVTSITDASLLAQREKTMFDGDLALAAANDIDFPIANTFGELSVPTYFTKVNDTYFLVDCYHNQILYHDNTEDPVWQWNVLPGELAMPHTIASDGTVYLVDDTENHRVVVYERYEGHFIITQTFEHIGIRPHYSQYNEADQTFYVWSSMTGEMYLFKRADEDDAAYHPVYLAEIRKINKLDGVYVRSFTIMEDEIYIVSGNSTIIRAKLADFTIIEEYPVPAEMAGMIQISRLGSMFYITISTDACGNQDYATIIRTEDLRDLVSGGYEDIYEWFIGGGTPYYISEVDGSYYMTEHRIPGHSLWRFEAEGESIRNITEIY